MSPRTAATADRLTGWALARAVQRRDPRSTRRRKKQAALEQHEYSPFGWELYLLHRGDLIADVLDSFCGECSRGRAWKAAFMFALGHFIEPQTRRKALEHWLRTFEQAALHRGVWMVRGAKGHVGRDHIDVDVIDEETGEVKRGKKHFPAFRGGKPAAGKLAARTKRSPRQQRRYRKVMRDSVVPVWRTRRQHWLDPDAVLPKPRRDRMPSTWAYAEHMLPMDPSPEMLRRWGVDPEEQLELGGDPFFPTAIIARADVGIVERIGPMLDYAFGVQIPY